MPILDRGSIDCFNLSNNADLMAGWYIAVRKGKDKVIPGLVSVVLNNS